MSLDKVICKVCAATGSLRHKKVYRLSGPSVFVGWLFNIATLTWIGAWSFIGSAASQSAANADAQSVASGISAFMVMTGFVSGLIGYLLTMKKKILACESCKTVVGDSV